MNDPLPFTRENIINRVANMVAGFIGGLVLVGLAYLLAGVGA